MDLERPHLAQVREATRLILRSDGWSSVRIGSRDRTAAELRVPTPPDFVTVRPNADTEYLDAWFRNEDVDAGALISFARDCPRPADKA